MEAIEKGQIELWLLQPYGVWYIFCKNTGWYELINQKHNAPNALLKLNNSVHPAATDYLPNAGRVSNHLISRYSHPIYPEQYPSCPAGDLLEFLFLRLLTMLLPPDACVKNAGEALHSFK